MELRPLWSWLAVVVVSTVLSGASATNNDPRNILNGVTMLEEAYLDQPYCVINGEVWVCVITGNTQHAEGGPGEHMLSVYSKDKGLTWSSPSIIESNTTLINAYGVPTIAPTGRIFCIYNMNLQNISHLPNGQPIGRSDELGYFVMRYSDDNGQTWSGQRYPVPYRSTAIDRNNSWGGKVKIMWSVDQVKHRHGITYHAFTKIGKYPQGPPEEVFFLSSPNLLTVGNVSDVTWNLFPSGERGLPPPGGNPNIGEEPHIVPLYTAPGFFVVYRTTQGYLAASATNDATAASGWTTANFSRFLGVGKKPSADLQSLGAPWPYLSNCLKNPRGPITLKRFSNGLYLLLWYFNSDHSYHSRNPYWLSAGWEVSLKSTPDDTEDSTTIVAFSQPEVIIYNAADQSDRPGYPDFIEDTSTSVPSVYITETQKSIARIHKVPETLLALLWEQNTIRQRATGQLAVSFNSTVDSGKVLPCPTLPRLVPGDSPLHAGLTAEFWVSSGSFTRRRRNSRNQRLLHAMDAQGRGVVVEVNGSGTVTVTVSIGKANNTRSVSSEPTWVIAHTDSECSRAILPQESTNVNSSAAATLHYVSVLLDAGPGIVSFTVDGKVCDGGAHSDRGWAWFDTSALGDVNPASGTPLLVGKAAGFTGTMPLARVYTRALYNSELVGNYRLDAELLGLAA